MAHVKGVGTTSLGRDSKAKRLGIKAYAGEQVRPGMIIVRQRGSAMRAGKNIRRGNDDTLYAVTAGKVQFRMRKVRRFDGTLKSARFVDVVTS
ncbi:MAG: 50S ribosomal protein L27 [Patescibacteria group bacterium]